VTRKSIVLVVVYALVALILAAEMLPLLWMFSTSFKLPGQYFTNPPTWFASQPTFDHYRVLFSDMNFARYLRNSFAVTAMTTILAIGLGTFSAYAIARLKTGANLLMPLLFVKRMAPAAAIIIPIYLIAAGLGLTDTIIGLTLAHLSYSLPIAVWLMIGFFNELPVAIEEAALIDGCSRWQSLVRVVLPLSAPGIAATAILIAIASWNEFFFAVILTNTPRSQTLPVAVANLVTPTQEILWGPMAAAGVVAIVPVLIFALMVQKHLVNGLTGGAVKG
jgi:multiple sugar transport system permease protein